MWCPFPRKSVCLLPFLCCLTAALYAADPTPIQQEIQQLDAKIDETRLRERELSDRMAKTRRELTELKLQLHAFTKAIRETEQAAHGFPRGFQCPCPSRFARHAVSLAEPPQVANRGCPKFGLCGGENARLS